jgi:hypothetical protein
LAYQTLTGLTRLFFIPPLFILPIHPKKFTQTVTPLALRVLKSDKEMSEQELFERIKGSDEKALEYLYKKYYRMMTKLVITNSGTEEEARDVFQDALIVFWQKARSGNLVMTAKISTYIYSLTERNGCPMKRKIRLFRWTWIHPRRKRSLPSVLTNWAIRVGRC